MKQTPKSSSKRRNWVRNPHLEQREQQSWVCYGGMHACMLRSFSHVQLFKTPWTVACQAPLSMGFSRPEHWSGLPCPPPGDLPDPGIESESLTSPGLALFTSSATWEACYGGSQWQKHSRSFSNRFSVMSSFTDILKGYLK